MSARRTSIATVSTLARYPVSGLRGIALRRGFLNGSRPWMALAVVLWGARLLRRASSRRPEVVSIERLKPGQTLQVTALHSTGGRGER